MYINDSDELRDAVLKALKTHGIKPRIKREPQNRRRQNDGSRGNSIIFRIPLEQLPSTEVCLDCGAYVSVPCIVVQLCDRILADIHMEGIFRKNGSQARQHDIKVMLEKGGRITSGHHVIDVAVLLKEFLRCLPVPLIPYNFHDDFLKCLTSDKCLESMLLLTLVLPPSHLNMLAYVMQFLNQISSQCSQNKMNAHNLSVVIAPNIMPCTSRNTFMCANALARAESCRRIVEDLITNASAIGSIPTSVQSHAPRSSTPNEDYLDLHIARRKRRSASLTRMFSGLKRMVAKNNAMEDPGPCTGEPSQAPPEPRTPVPPIAVTSPGGKKRKCPQEPQPALGFSAKKRCDESEGYLHAPIPAKKKFFSHSASNLKKSTTSLKERARKSFSGTGLKISRLKLRKSKSKEKGLDTTDEHELNAPLDSEPGPSDPKTPTSPVDYVCVPKHEYEQMEKRVSQIETRISQEFGRNRLNDDDSRVEPKSRRPSIENVQTEYVKTLDKVEQLNSTCDNLAERLGRDLRIRRSYDGSRIHRSPSARKIGSLRRRSRERAAKPLSRHHSLNIHDKSPSHRMERTRSVRRRNSNAAVSVSSGVGKSTTGDKSPGKDTAVTARGRITRQTAPRRAQSCLVGAKRSNIPVKQVGPGWQCAQTFLRKPVPPMLMETRRDSIAKLKEQNAGMVMAKAKLFDHYADENEKGKEETGLEGKMRHRTRLSMTGVNVKPAEEGSRVLRRSMPYQDLTSGRRKSIASENINPVKKPQENISQRMSIDDTATRGLRKSLAEVTGNKENLLSETLENIIYDTCKVRTPDMPIIKKPLTGTRSISFRKPQGTRTPMPLTATPRRSPRLVELKTRPLIS